MLNGQCCQVSVVDEVSPGPDGVEQSREDVGMTRCRTDRDRPGRAPDAPSQSET